MFIGHTAAFKFVKTNKNITKNVKTHILILVCIFSCRGQCEAVWLIQSDR